MPPVLLLRFFPILLRVSSHLVSPSTIQHHSSGLRGVITHTYLPLRVPPSLSRVFAFPQDREPASGIRITPELKGVDLPPALYYRVRDMNVKPGTERRALLFDLCKVGYGPGVAHSNSAPSSSSLLLAPSLRRHGLICDAISFPCTPMEFVRLRCT